MTVGVACGIVPAMDATELETRMQALIARSGYIQAMGMRLVACGEGHATVHCPLTAAHLNTAGICHGGVITGLCDMAAGVATKSRLDDPDGRVVSISLTVNFQRPGLAGRCLVAQARVRSGRSIVCCDVDMRDDEGTAIATALVTLKVG